MNSARRLGLGCSCLVTRLWSLGKRHLLCDPGFSGLTQLRVVDFPASDNKKPAERQGTAYRRARAPAHMGCAGTGTRASKIAARHLAGDMIGLPDASATMVSVGFSAAPVVKTEPSETNRLSISWVWPHLLTTPSRAFSDIRLVPRLCVLG